MAIDYDKLMQLDIPAVEQTYDARDAMLSQRVDRRLRCLRRRKRYRTAR